MKVYYIIIILILILNFILTYKTYKNYKDDIGDIGDIGNIDNIDDIEKLRCMINEIDDSILLNIHNRSLIVKRIWEIKKSKGISIYDKTREEEIMKRIISKARKLNLHEDKILSVHSSIIGDHFHKS